MILNTGKNAEVQSVGIDHSVTMSIDAQDQGVLMAILSGGLYKDPVGSVIREWTSNALDSHTEAGVTEPVLVEVVSDSSGNSWFKVTDFGVGISPERLEKIISKYAASTKRHDNSMLGAFGLGLKSGLSYSDSFSFITRYNGKESHYLMYKAEEGTKIDLLHEQDTDLRNGTTFQIQIKNYSDRNEFEDKVARQLPYFESVYFNVDGISNDFKITKHADWKHSEMNEDSYMHISLDNVYYAIDYQKLDIKSIGFPVALNFSVGEGLIPTPSREDITYTPSAKALILKKIEKVADHFISEWNSSMMEAESLFDIHDKFRNPFVYIGENTYSILPLQKYSNITIKEPTLKGVKLVSPERIHSIRNSILNNYTLSGRIIHGALDGKYSSGYLDAYRIKNTKIPHILVKDKPKGVLLEYIKETIGDCYFVKKVFDWKLGSKKTRMSYASAKHTYYDILDLDSHPKSEWRQRIREFNSIVDELFVSRLINIEDIKPTEEWLKARKDRRKKATRVSVEKNEIYPKYARYPERGGDLAVFQSETVETVEEQATTKKVLHIYGKVEDKELLSKIFFLTKNKRSVIVMLTERDIKKLEKVNPHNWISIQKFMEGKTAVFKAYATALRIGNVIANNRVIFRQLEFIKTISKDFYDVLTSLVEYKKMYNVNDYGAESLKTIILDFATENDLWDESIIENVKLAEKELSSTFDFIGILFNESTRSTKLDPITLRAAVDILKYRKFKLNLEYYQIPPSVDLKEELKEELLETDIEERIEF